MKASEGVPESILRAVELGLKSSDMLKGASEWK
jgi:hypothetical protein